MIGQRPVDYSQRPLICAFAKVRNEIVREGNIYRLLRNLEHYSDAAVICDDASTDGTNDVIAEWCQQQNSARRSENFIHIRVPSAEQEFRNELAVKQKMLQFVHALRPHFIMWMDGDEVLDRLGTAHLRTFCEGNLDQHKHIKAWRFHYTQLWRGSRYARTDEGFDDGYFIKLWRYSPDLCFTVQEGTHHAQFPLQVMAAFHAGAVDNAPFECIHYGNYGTNLRWKVIQYRHGLGGWERHLRFGQGEFRKVKADIIPEHVTRHESPYEIARQPTPFTTLEVERIKMLDNMKSVPKMFAVVIPAFNRADTLPRALQSLLNQSYQKWAAIVLDDGSTDITANVMRKWQDLDPRIFYARYEENRGGVAMNNIGMDLACEAAEWWTRLGSDDYFGPHKLMNDAYALMQHEACFGLYQVERDGKLEEFCNGPCPAPLVRRSLLAGTFMASWANVAVRTDVLKRIKAKYGSYCDPSLRNMEDFLVNVRIARETADGFVFRCRLNDDSRTMPHGSFDVIVDPTEEQCREVMNLAPSLPLDAVWRCVTTGASGNALQTTQDENITRALITKENIQYSRRI